MSQAEVVMQVYEQDMGQKSASRLCCLLILRINYITEFAQNG